MPASQLFRIFQCADQQGNLITQVKIPGDGKPVGNGNNVAVAVVDSSGGTETITVTDNKGNVYTQRVTVTDSARLQIWTKENITNGPDTIYIQSAAAGSPYFSACWGEACGVGAFDTSHSLTGADTAPNSGPFTPAAGALIFTAANQDSSAAFLTQWTPGTGYTMESCDLMLTFIAAQWRLHTSGATTPAMTINTSRSWSCGSISWLADTSKGTDPDLTIRVTRMLHSSFQSFTPSPWKIQGPAVSADTLAIWAEISPAAGIITGITDTAGNTWRFAGAASEGPPTGQGGRNECWYTDRPASSNTNIISVSFSGGSAGDCMLTFIALRNTLASAVQDNADTLVGLDTVGTSILGTNVEPSVLHCMILSMLGVESNTVLSVTPGFFVSCTSTPTIASPAPLQQNNGYCIEYPDNTTVIQRTWTLDAAPGNYQELNVVFLGVPPPAARDLEGFRFRDDDGSESSATWLAAENTNVSRATLTNTRLRALTDVTNDPPNEGVKIQYRQVGDNQWRDIN